MVKMSGMVYNKVKNSNMTAVDYIDLILIDLTKKFNNKEHQVACNTLINFKNVVIKQAKQMEKQQIKEAYLRGIKNYDQTFKSE